MTPALETTPPLASDTLRAVVGTLDDYAEQTDTLCPKCGANTLSRHCNECEDGFSHHDCGEDCCCCLDPEPNVVCDECGGHGYLEWCPVCGWDLVFKNYINGRDERERANTSGLRCSPDKGKP